MVLEDLGIILEEIFKTDEDVPFLMTVSRIGIIEATTIVAYMSDIARFGGEFR